MPAQTTRNPAKKHASGDGKRRRRPPLADRDADGRNLHALAAWDYSADNVHARRIEVAWRKHERKQFGPNPYDRECAILRPGRRRVPTAKVMAHAFGKDDHGVVWQADVGQMLTCGDIDTGKIGTEEIRDPDSVVARKMLRVLLLVLGCMRRTDKGGIAVRGKQAFVGRQHRIEVMTEAEHRLAVDQAAVERELTDPNWTPFDEDPHVERARRVYVPKAQQGALAARADLSVRQFLKYARLFRAAGVLRLKRVPSDSEDAIMPRTGKWAYPEWVLCKGRTIATEVIGRLQRWWVEKPAKPRPSSSGSSAPTVAVERPAARGPPYEAAGVAANDDTDADIKALAQLRLQVATKDPLRELR